MFGEMTGNLAALMAGTAAISCYYCDFPIRYEGRGLAIGGDEPMTCEHRNNYLSSTEVAILKAWAWEEAHRDKDGPAHQLFREHGIDMGQPLALLHAADLELPNTEVLGDRIVPAAWPWGEQSLNEICDSLRTRSDLIADGQRAAIH
jgi:hypothetical protein